jgi:hypothetical protein
MTILSGFNSYFLVFRVLNFEIRYNCYVKKQWMCGLKLGINRWKENKLEAVLTPKPVGYESFVIMPAPMVAIARVPLRGTQSSIHHHDTRNSLVCHCFSLSTVIIRESHFHRFEPNGGPFHR